MSSYILSEIFQIIQNIFVSLAIRTISQKIVVHGGTIYLSTIHNSPE